MAIHVIEVKNPFERKIDNQYYQTYVGGPVTDYVTHADYERVFAVNGIPVDETYIPDDGDEILVAPKVGKKAFRWILPATLVLVGAALGAGIIGGQMLIGWRIGLALAATMIGNHMIEKMTKPAVDLTNTEQSNTYGWGTPSTLTGQGYVLPALYGTVKTAGLMLQRHVVSDGDKQYLSILYCLAQGPIDSITDIKLNGNPLTNYQNCEIETRMGTNTQTVMKNFNDSYADTALVYELNNDSVWHTVQCDGNDAQGLEITLSFPQGLYHSNDKGNPDWTGVTIEAQYRKVGDTDWIKIPVWNENYTWEPIVPNGNSWNRRFQRLYGTSAWWQTHWQQDCGTFQGYEVDYTYTRRGKTYTVYKTDDDGNYIEKWTYSMTLDEYKNKVIASHNGDGVIRQKKTDAFYRVYDVYGLEPAQYEVRVRCTHKDDTSTRTANKIQWVGITQIIYDDFRYPGKALLGLKALATDQLSGSDPQLTCMISRSLVWVWNPDTKAYEQKPAANPAWAAYDILHQCRKLTSVDGKDSFVATGIPYENIDYDAFNAWADMCDANNIDFNYLYDSAMKLYDALQYPCRVGYGAIVLIGTKVSCIYDCASDPVQLFTVANIKKDSFSNEYQSTDDRANCIEVSFINKDKNYERDVLAVYSDAYNDSDVPSQPTQVELMGCTDVNQAYRYGAYKLRSNKYEIRTVSFEAFADAIACQIGDVILVQEDVTSWGLGGRIKAVNGSTITIDRDATSEGSDFTTMLVRSNSTDKLTYYKISAVDGDKVILAGTSSDIEADCIYALGYKGHEAKKFRVLSISTGHSDETRTIQAIEYYPELYDMDVTNLPEIERYDDTVEPPKDLILLTEKYSEADGTITNIIHATWINPRTLNPVIMEISLDGENWTYEKKFISGKTQYALNVLSMKTYYVRLYAVNDVGVKSEYCTAHILTDGSNSLSPNAPKNLTVTKVEWNSTQLKLKWGKDSHPAHDIKGYNIYMNGSKIADDVKDTFFTYTAASSNDYSFSVSALDYENRESDKSNTVSVTVKIEPADVSGFTITQLATNRAVASLKWSANHEVDLSYYQVRTGDSWDDGKIVVDKTKALSAQYTLPSSGTYKFWIKAVNAEGYFSVNASYADVDASLEPNAVTNLSVRQSTKDRSKAVISFSPSGGVDIDAYTIKRGDSWATGTVVAKTKETSVTIDIPSNDATTYMVQAKTIAGYESSVASYNFVAMVNPLDVTNFKAKKSTSESTRIVLTWDAPEESDIAYYVIKEGSDWDSAKTVAPRVSNVTYDVIVKDENTHNWMIKAVTIAGNESLHAASVSGVFSLRPTAVSAIQVAQSDTDRSKLLINWTNIDDPDLAGYETKIGDNWDSGEPLPFTKEIYAEKVLTASGTYQLMVKAKNTAGYYSDETSTTVNVKVEPDDVGGFIALQNGDSIELYWDRLAEKDIENYEIREGFSYDEGTPVDRGVTGTSVIRPIDVTRFYHYFIKARNKAGFESVHASSAAVNVTALLPRNVIMTFDEIALANGNHSNTLFTNSKYNWQTFGGRFSDYPALKWEEAGSQKVLALNMPQVRNSDFSSSDISNWINQGTALTYDSSVGHERAGSLKFKGPNRCYVILPLAKGTQITFSAWVKGKGAYLHVEYKGDDYSWNSPPNSKTSETDEWTKLSLTCPVTTSATSAFLFVYSQSEVWIDDVEITYNHVEGTYTTPVIDVSSVITCNVTTVFYSTTAMRGGSATLMVRASQDNETWTSWQVFKPVQRTFRYIQFKVDMSTENTARSPEVSKFVISIDVPDTDIALKQTIAKGGSTVGYGHTFYTVPAVVAAAVGEGYHAEIVSRGKESCVIKVKDKSNTDTGGTCDIRIKGY